MLRNYLYYYALCISWLGEFACRNYSPNRRALRCLWQTSGYTR
jgi:hypothetical protein